MDVWKSKNWENNSELNNSALKSGLILKFDSGINSEYKRASMEFCKWLRRSYVFPARIPIYFKTAEYVVTLTGIKCPSLFSKPLKDNGGAYIKMATGDLEKLQQEIGRDNALASLLCSIAYELTHYFQWINDITLTDKGYELQAHYYSHRLIKEYALTRDHP